MRIGILALQGGAAEHERALRKCSNDISTVLIRKTSDLHALDGMILPGGESTVQRRLLLRTGMTAPLQQVVREGLPVWGTCAGLILLAGRISSGETPVLGTMDIVVERNRYGSQLHSFREYVRVEGLPGEAFPAVFIRAPGIRSWGSSVEILARSAGVPVALRQKHMLATAFHPELTDDLRMHRLFIAMAAAQAQACSSCAWQ